MISIYEFFMVSNCGYDIFMVLGATRKITYVFFMVLNMFLFGDVWGLDMFSMIFLMVFSWFYGFWGKFLPKS